MPDNNVKIVARLEIILDEAGNVSVQGQGAYLQQRAWVYGILELAKEVVRDGGRPQLVTPASAADLSIIRQ